MTLDDIKSHYVTWQNAMRKLGMSQFTYSYWKRNGYVPIDAQLKIEKATQGVLKADLNDIKK